MPNGLRWDLPFDVGEHRGKIGMKSSNTSTGRVLRHPTYSNSPVYSVERVISSERKDLYYINSYLRLQGWGAKITAVGLPGAFKNDQLAPMLMVTLGITGFKIFRRWQPCPATGGFR